MKANHNISLKRNGLINTSMVIGLIFMLQGCYYDKEQILYPASGTPTDCATVPATFSSNVQPLLVSRCAIPGCHNSASASGGVVLETYNQVNAKKDRINQRAVVEKSMPPTGPLPPAEIAKIKCWLDAGAPNN